MMTCDRLYKIFLQHPDVCTDSRQVRPNSLFFALKGDSFNGNHFAGQALEEGAAYAVVDEAAVVTDDRFILVEDVLTSLQQLAHYHRKQLGIPVIAITGTNGKTTTKELIASVLATRFRVEYTRGNLNNHIGVPLTLLSMNGETETGIVEMGANHPGEIDFLCRIAEPDYGIVTNMGKAHLEGFGGLQGVIRTKSELYRYIAEKSGTVFLNGDNPLLTSSVGDQKEVVLYGLGVSFPLNGEILNEPPWCTLIIREYQSGTIVRSRLIGDYNAENILAAAAIGRYFGVTMDQIVGAIERYTPANSRSQLLIRGTNRIILDAYNANPTSMLLALSNFLSMEEAAKTVILGDMLELGVDSAPEHQAIVDLLRQHQLKEVFLVGSFFGQTRKPDHFHSFPHREDLSEWLLSHPLSNRLILVKGSHGIRLDRVVEAIN